MDNQFELEESAGFDYKAFFVKLGHGYWVSLQHLWWHAISISRH